MVASTIPHWFRVFLSEYRAEREATGLALKTLAESMQHLAEEIREIGGRVRLVEIRQERTNEKLERNNQELVRTRKQSANLFGRRGMRARL